MTTLEMVTMRFRDDDEAQRQALEASSRFLAGCEGFRGRRVARDGDGEWLDLVEWRDEEAARAAAARFPGAPEVAPFMALLDLGQVAMRYWQVVGSWGAQAGLPRLVVQELDAAERFFGRTTSVLTEEHAGFRPTPEGWNAAQQVLHAAWSVDWFTEGAFGAGFTLDFAEHERAVAAAESLEAARRYLGEAFDRARERFGGAGEESLAAPMPENPILGPQPRFTVVWAITDHTAHHRGALAVYARLLGLEPPMPYV